ncbi:MAG: hypothetical protein ABMA13_07115 [Chthoniobacteraceae bacterium]
MNRILNLILIAAATVLLPGCVTYEREWRLWNPPPAKESRNFYSKSEPPPTPQSSFDGRWLGRWTSDRHRKPFSSEMEGGELRCIFTRIDPYRYRANFRAEWMLGASTYLTQLYGKQRGNTLHLHGQDQVSRIFGGIYTYDGKVTPNHFTLRYDSSYDSGTFEMRKLR